MMNNCLVASNSATEGGGVRAIGTASFLNCTIVNNSATNYGGIITSNGPVLNCIIYFNQAQMASNHLIYFGASASNTCTFPWPPSISGETRGNITNEPAFVDFAGGDFRLQPGSPCIDSGNNSYVIAGTDLAGASRIYGNAVDMGAFEFYAVQPALRIWQSGENITLAWPLWAGDFGLQQVGAAPSYAGGWSNLNASSTVISNENTVTVPMDREMKLFRLSKP
jgi:hypothetical protein